MLRWIGRSLQRKLSVIMLAATLIPLLSLGVFAYLISSRITEENTKQSGIDTLAQMRGNLRFIVEDVNHLSIFLIGEREVQQYLRASGDDGNARVRIQGFYRIWSYPSLTCPILRSTRATAMFPSRR